MTASHRLEPLFLLLVHSTCKLYAKTLLHLPVPTHCRSQASDGNGKPGLLFGLKNPFRGLKFGRQGNDNEATQTEQEESQQQPAADKAQPVAHSMPWKAWTKV